MKRRDVIFGLSVCALPFKVAAAEMSVRKVGVFMGTKESEPAQRALVHAFISAMEDRNWIAGKNVEFLTVWANGDAGQIDEKAATLKQWVPDAILANGSSPALASIKLMPTTPLVFVNVTDPLGQHIVSSLPHPSGQVTGFSNYEPYMVGKWLGILKEAVRGLQHILIVSNPRNRNTEVFKTALEEIAKHDAIKVTVVSTLSDIALAEAFKEIGAEQSGGAIVLPDFISLSKSRLIVDLETRNRVPTMYFVQEFTQAGGFLSYGISLKEIFVRSTDYINRILLGIHAGDLPVQAPTTFEFVINLKAAAQLNIEVSPYLLAQADDVIE